MALKSPMMPSPSSGLGSSFSPYSDSPNSPFPAQDSINAEKRSSGQSESLAPPASPYPQSVEPSPVDSNGTESTEIEEDAQESSKAKSPVPNEGEESNTKDEGVTSPLSREGGIMGKINTHMSQSERSEAHEHTPQSAIHDPAGYKKFPEIMDTTSPTENSEGTVRSPTTPEPISVSLNQDDTSSSSVNTDVPRYLDRSTPLAQTRQELEESDKRKSRRTSSLEDIPEALDRDHHDFAEMTNGGSPSRRTTPTKEAPTEFVALRTALTECWTLCNTLANLSSHHRQRTFQLSSTQKTQEQAWRSCWRLCQQLYDSRDEGDFSQVIPILDLCREFCQALFDARSKTDEGSDSVLRVSFELNNHLYNTHDRNLPEAFIERTLDFYITLCHRLMKQRTSLPEETDALLRACWSLAENLYNMRQSTRGETRANEEMLSSAIQSCWELCDLFREGWTQVRPDRTTPRPSQTKFPSHHSYRSKGSNRSEPRTNSSLSSRQYHDAPSLPPETPTTIFDDATTATSSPDSGQVPNILVLGPASMNGSSDRMDTHHERWTSGASVFSGYSESASSSPRTSSTATASSEEAHLTRLRCLLLKAGMNSGFSRTSGQQLPSYVANLPNTTFGTLPWQMKVFAFYKKLVMGDKSMMSVNSAPSRRLSANDVARSVKWLGNSEQWAWMRDLFRVVFGFGVDEAERRGATLQI